MKRLTVHVTNQPRVDTKEPVKSNKKAPSKSSYEAAIEQGKADKANASKENTKGQKGRYKVYNTITVRDLKDTRSVTDALSEIRNKYTIAICEDSKRSNWKPGEEMYHIANQK
jgi:hypothetical protein